MDKKTAMYLWDALDACNDISNFLSEVDIGQYFDDAKTRAAVERKLEVIGEALNRVSKRDPIVAAEIGVRLSTSA